MGRIMGNTKIFQICKKNLSINSKPASVVLIPGDGSGPERIYWAYELAKAANLNIEWHIINLSERNPFQSHLLSEAIDKIKTMKYCLKGPIASIQNQDFPVPLNVKLRQDLDTYFSLTKFKNLNKKIPAIFHNVDIALIRESTEGEYSSIEHEITPGVVENIKVTSRQKSMRIAKEAFDYALTNSRKKVTVVHKANIMKMTDGLFLQCARDVHQSDPKYSKLELNDLIVDNCCMQLLANPYNFDVILTSNLYGNIISNILTSLIGGPGIIPGWLYGPGITIYESGSRKSDSCSAGKNIVNPIGEILALSYLADDIAIKTDSKRRGESIRKALNDLLDNNPESYTFDMGGSATTSEFMAKLMSKVEKYI